MALNMKKLVAPLLTVSLLLPSVNAFAGSDPFSNEKPSTLAMFTDLLIIRPTGILVTTFGAVAYVVALPFTLASGGVQEAGDVLVAEPAYYTFVRCLGCTKAGYNRSYASAVSEDESVQQAAEETKMLQNR